MSNRIRDLLNASGYLPRTEDKAQILRTLNALRIDPKGELGTFYLQYNPSLLQSQTSFEQLEDVLAPVIDDAPDERPVDPFETPVGSATRFARDLWEIPENVICLTTTEGEGGYLYDLSSGAVYDFTLDQQKELCEGILPPRWSSFFEFLSWYLS